MKKRIPHPTHPEWYVKELEASEGSIPEAELDELWSKPFDSSPIPPERQKLRALFDEVFPQATKGRESIIHLIINLSGKMRSLVDDVVIIPQPAHAGLQGATRGGGDSNTPKQGGSEEAYRRIHGYRLIARMIEGKAGRPVMEVDLLREESKLPIRPFSYSISYNDEIAIASREVSPEAKPSQRRLGTPKPGIYEIIFRWETYTERLCIKVADTPGEKQ